MVQHQPGSGQEEADQHGLQRRHAPGIDLEAAQRAHRTGEERRHRIGVVHQQRHRRQPDQQGQADQRRHQIGASFQRDLALAAAGRIPVAQQMQREPGCGQQHQRIETGSQQQGERGGLEDHAIRHPAKAGIQFSKRRNPGPRPAPG
jgi:hypothetical protein